uniref:Citrate transporter-like domain-containing protein n=1 Tax=Ascaris lumbricoides TaxID=6252 RepID=A0A9J2QAC0_ASCLU
MSSSSSPFLVVPDFDSTRRLLTPTLPPESSGVSTATLGLSEDMLAITNSSSTQPICESDEDEPPPDPQNVTTLTKRILTDVTYFWRSFVLILTPILLAPCLISPDSTYRCAFCVSLMAVYWVCEVIPLPVTALLPVVLFPISGILDAATVAKEFINVDKSICNIVNVQDTNFLFIGGLIMAVAVEKCHLHERVALRVVTLVGSQPRWIMFGFMSVTALLSMFVSNTATTAMMVPIAQSVSDQLLKSYRARRSRRSTIEKRPDNEDILVHRIEIVQDLPSTKEETDMAKGLIICICFAANIGGTATITGTPPNLVMVGQIATLFPDVDTDLNYLTWIGFAFPLMVVCLLACYLILLGFFLRHSPPADEEAANVMRRRYDKLPPMSFAEKSVLCCFILLILLWMCRDPQVVPGFGEFFPRGHYTDATSAMLVSVVLFALPDEMPDFICHTKRDRVSTPKRRGALMDWKTIQAQFPWSVVLLLGGGFALAAVNSG